MSIIQHNHFGKFFYLFLFLLSSLASNCINAQIFDLEDYKCQYDKILELYKERDSLETIVDVATMSQMINIAAIEDKSVLQDYCKRLMALSTDNDSYYYKAFFYSKINDRNFNSWDSVLQVVENEFSKESDIYKMLSVGKAAKNFSISNPDCSIIDSIVRPVSEHISDMDFFYFSKAAAFQIRSICASALGDKDTAINFERERMKIIETHYAACARQKGSAYVSLGRRFQAGGELDSALIYYSKAKAFFAAYRPFAPEDHLMASVNIASVETAKGFPISAITELNETRIIAESTFDDSAEELINKDISSTLSLIYNRLGDNYQMIGNVNRATQFYQKAIQAIEQIDPKPSIQKLTSYANVGRSLIKLDQLDLAEQYLMEGLNLANELLPSDHQYTLTIISGLGEIERIKTNDVRSYEYFSSIAKMNQSKYGNNHFLVADNLLKLADVCQSVESSDCAIENIMKSLKIYRDTYGDQHPSIALALSKLSKLLLKEGNMEQALKANQEGIEALAFSEIPSESADPLLLLDLQIANAKMKYENWKSNDIGTVEVLSQSFKESENTFNFLVENSEELNDRSEIMRRSADLFDSYSNYLYELFTKNRSELLEESIRMADVDKAFGIQQQLAAHVNLKSVVDDPDVYVEWKKLKSEKAEILFKIRKIDVASSQHLQLAVNLETIDAQLEILESTLRDDNIPFNLMNNHFKWKLEDIQSQIAINEVIVHFSIFDDELLVYFIYSNHVDHQQVTFPGPIRGNSDENEMNSGIMSLGDDHNRILGELFDRIEDGTNSIIIIPDQELSRLPFEFIPWQNSHLLHFFAISYAPSLSVWSMTRVGKDRNFKYPYSGFAPSYQNVETLSDLTESPILAAIVRSGNWSLPFAQREVKEIKKVLGGRDFTGDQANKMEFIQALSNSKVVHLSMHAQMDEFNPGNSRFLFGNEENDEQDLLLHELYNLNTYAEMVVLSACETGIGKYQKGQGAKSLANGFLYAGVPATVMSLWKVPDESTSQIMISFYKYLKEGMRKDQSLRLAKLDYLRNAVSEKQKDPFFWAGLVLVGNPDPIVFTSLITPIWILGGVLGIVLLGFIIRRVI